MYFDGGDTLLTDEVAYHFERDSAFTVAVVARTSSPGCQALIARTQPAFPGTDYQGWQTFICDGCMSFDLSSHWDTDAVSRRCLLIAPESTRFNTYIFVSTGTGRLDGLSVRQNAVDLTTGCTDVDGTPGSINVAGLPTSIGARHLGDRQDTADNWLTGWIAEIRIYNRALSPAEALALHALLDAKWITAAAPGCTP
ncbi:MAG: LamG domain-containing protein [Polyangiaceae bacterium]|nr:LamG domain-containing protein [Polyangiaceae bacterium]